MAGIPVRRRRALLSVTDKSGLADFARGLVAHGFELVASGGTATALREAGFDVTDVDAITGYPEIFGGRVKTLHPAVHGGILGPDEESFAATKELGITPIDLVAVNLYRFGEARAQGGTEAQLVSKIDVGGPTMLRAAAKNFQRVTVVPDPAHYAEVLAELELHDGSTSLELRRRLAAAVFRLTERYDDAIADWLEGVTGSVDHGVGLRYGENPHQGARMFLPGGGDLASVGLVLHGGKELSYNNLVDLIAGLKLAGDFREPCCAILKHTNPCGLAKGTTVIDGFQAMEGNGPVGGTPVEHRVAVSSLDWLAADRTAVALMGIDFEKMGYLNFCASAGYGEADLARIEILGERIADHVRTYRLADNIDKQLEWMNPLIG